MRVETPDIYADLQQKLMNAAFRPGQKIKPKELEDVYGCSANTIRENTFCCGSGAGLNAGEDMELRLTGGLPRANAVRYVHEKFGVNMLACVCAIDRAALPALMEYWVPEVDVTGVHELVANALNLTGQNERAVDLRGEDIPGLEGESEEKTDE